MLNGYYGKSSCKFFTRNFFCVRRIFAISAGDILDLVKFEGKWKRIAGMEKRCQINWEKKKELVESGEIDCIMGCFSMEGCLDDYRWAGPYIASRQVVAVNESSDIYKLSDLEGKNLAVQSTTKPEGIFLNRTDERIPKLGNLISLGHRELIYTFLGKGYVDAVAAHEESIVQYMKDYDYSVTCH